MATHVDDLIGGGPTPEVLKYIHDGIVEAGFHLGHWDEWDTVLGFGITRNGWDWEALPSPEMHPVINRYEAMRASPGYECAPQPFLLSREHFVCIT